MSDGTSQFALREWWGYMRRRQTLIGLAGASLFVTLAAPFGSGAYLSFLPRLAYWTVTVFVTFAAGTLISMTIERRLRGVSEWLRVMAIGTPIGLAVLGIVVAINAVVYGWTPPLRDWLQLAVTVLLLSYLITLAFDAIEKRKPRGEADTETAPKAPALLDRLPLDKRGPLIAVSVEDHYVRIRTTKGEELILMRLSDAIRETAPTHGAQVHRSHWVAFDAVASVARKGDGAVLTMSDGTTIPVSRANVKKLKEAGLMPA